MDSVKCRLSMPRLTVKARVRSSPIDSLCARHKQNIREIPLNSNANILVLLKEVIWLLCLRPNIQLKSHFLLQDFSKYMDSYL